MTEALHYWKALEHSQFLTDADEEQLFSHTGWKLVENINNRNPIFKWVLFSTPVAMVSAFHVFCETGGKASLVVGGASLLFATWVSQFFHNNNPDEFLKCIKIFTKCDKSFKQFIVELREREIAHFSLRDSENAKLCCRKARVTCLKYLRLYAHQCITLTRSLKEHMDYPITFAYEMLHDNQSLIDLVAIEKPIVDDHLLIDALKNMHHFLFVCRSEMFHIFMVDSIYRNDVHHDKELINKLMNVAAEFENQEFLTSFHYQPSENNNAQNYIHRLNSVPAQRRLACVILLESVLKQLNAKNELPIDSSDILKQVETVQKILTTHQKEVYNKLIASNPLKSDPLSDTDTWRMSESETNEQRIEKNSNNNNDDYQVFEAIPGTRDNEQKVERDDETNNVDQNSEGSISPKKGNFILDELRTKLQPRKEIALQKEREATAKFRKVPIEDVKLEDVMEEMQHTNKSMEVNESNENDWLNRPYIGKSVNMGTTASLISQLAGRRNAVQSDVIGDASDSD